MLVDDPAQQRAVGDVALVEDPVADERPRPGEQRVEDDRRVAGLLERLGRGRPDVAGAAGDQNLHAADPSGRRGSRRTPRGRSTLSRLLEPCPKKLSKTVSGSEIGRRFCRCRPFGWTLVSPAAPPRRGPRRRSRLWTLLERACAASSTSRLGTLGRPPADRQHAGGRCRRVVARPAAGRTVRRDAGRPGRGCDQRGPGPGDRDRRRAAPRAGHPGAPPGRGGGAASSRRCGGRTPAGCARRRGGCWTPRPRRPPAPRPPGSGGWPTSTRRRCWRPRSGVRRPRRG